MDSEIDFVQDRWPTGIIFSFQKPFSREELDKGSNFFI
jgi:hypothetical protein